MQRNLQDPLDAGNVALVAKNLPRVRALVPDAGWNTGANAWNALVDTALAAASRGDADATRQACKGCHRVWRAKYKAQFRTRPL
jgi:hypothetical protein